MLCLSALIAGCALADSPNVELRYRPTSGTELLYDAKLTTVLDFSLGRGMQVSGDMRFGVKPTEGLAEGDERLVAVDIREGGYQVEAQKRDFTEESLSWLWAISPLRAARPADPKPPEGLSAVIRLAMNFGFATEFAPHPVKVGDTWESVRTATSPTASATELRSRHTLVGLEDSPEHGPIAAIESDLHLPVDALFIGARWTGSFTGKSTVRFAVSDGELVSAHVTGQTELVGGGAKVTLRESDLTIERTTSAASGRQRVWSAGSERALGVSGSYTNDAVLRSNLVKYLRDDWVLYLPRGRMSLADGSLIGLGINARRSGRYLAEAGVYYGTRSESLAGTLTVTRGYPVRPTNQQQLALAWDGSVRSIGVSAIHFEGTRLGATGVPRMRYSLGATASRLFPFAPHFASEGSAHYLTLGLTRNRTGASQVRKGSLDWESTNTLTWGSRSLGGAFDFATASTTLVGNVRLSRRDALAARARVSVGLGEVPDQFRTMLTDGSALRGYGLETAPLVRHTASASLEYRRRIGGANLPRPIKQTDWWGAIFVDAATGGNDYASLTSGPLYVDAGITVRAGVQYRGVQLYGYGSLAWPLTGENRTPRLTFGVDWAF